MVNSYSVQTSNDEELKVAGWFGRTIAFLFPVIGVIMYFVAKAGKTVEDPDAYLLSAVYGFLIGQIIYWMILIINA